jgi:phosphoribosylformylglycinamidine synthase subunit PurL
MSLRLAFQKQDVPFEAYTIDIESISDEDLMELSKTMGLALSLKEMKRIQTYFMERKRPPTDIELQALGQAWSEHSCYKSSKIPLKKYVFGIAEDKIVAREDAGVIEFDDDHYYCAALESHNHPSAVEPYGGAATGVGGIVRDIVCMGAHPLAYVDPLFFGPLDTKQSSLPRGVKHPRYLFKGVVDGIRDYGNRIGVPTVSGQVYFHPGFTRNCLVNVGCIGIMKKEEMIHSSAKQVGDIFVYVGGKTGRDGIHGVTFASEELTDDSEESSRSAVQVGDPITKEPVIHVTLECNRRGWLEGLKDFGGGGLSCVSGELAYAAGFGAEIQLDKIPLKEEGLAPWEIWVSESQERMMFIVKQENLEKVLHLCKQWDVIAVPVGKVIKEPVARVFYEDELILDMDLDFYTGGPVYDETQRPYKIPKNMPTIEKDLPFDTPDIKQTMLRLLSSENIASKEWVIRQYDHEVQAHTVLKPLQGIMNKESHGDSSVLKPLDDSFKGLAVTANVNPRFMQKDPYHGAMSAVDETCRNLVAVGAKPDSLLDCLNFGNPEKPERMGEFYEACRGLGEIARELDLPFMSGNVSFYNEAVGSSVPPSPEIMGVGIVDDIRTCVSSDLKQDDSTLYLVGAQTKQELGGSEYYRLMNVDTGVVPISDIDLLKHCMNGLLETIRKGIVLSCHDVSEGGIGVCTAEMAIGGGIGFTIDVGNIPGNLRSDMKLFSESNTRWIVEVKNEDINAFEKVLSSNKTPFSRIGHTEGDQILLVDGKKTICSIPLKDAIDSWKNSIYSIMG